MKKIFMFTLPLLFLAAGATAENLTVYNDGYALYGDKVRFTMKDGVETYVLDDVPETIDTGSITIYPSSGGSGIVILEQNFDYDLVNTSAMLKKKLGKTIRVFSRDKNEYKGTLLAVDSYSVMIQTDNGIISIISSEIMKIIFERTGDLNIKPTLSWLIKSDVTGGRDFNLSYMLNGMSWNAKYNMTLEEDERSGMLISWIQLNNNSGKKFEKTELQLMAGDVKKITGYSNNRAKSMAVEMVAYDEEAGVSEESLMEYHLYTVGRKVSIGPRQDKELPFFPPVKAKVNKRIVYAINDYNKKVNVKIEFENKENNGLGIPMPAGIFSIYKRDKRGNVQFVGNDNIVHTPKNEKISLYIGDSFDVTGSTETLKREKIRKDTYVTVYKVTLKNRKDESATVYAEFRRQVNDELTVSEIEPEDKKSRNLVFPVKLTGNEEKSFQFEIRTEY